MDQAFDFGNANDEQRRAITTTEGPVLITAELCRDVLQVHG